MNYHIDISYWYATFSRTKSGIWIIIIIVIIISSSSIIIIIINPLKASPEYTRAGVNGKCVL